MTRPPIESARFVGGPMDGQGVMVDNPGEELPPMVAVDGGALPVCYRLEATEVSGEGVYVVDESLVQPFLKDLWKEEENDV
jgi:hypothetical protein